MGRRNVPGDSLPGGPAGNGELSRAGGRPSVLRHPQVVEDQPRAAMELPHLLRHIEHAF